MNLKQRIDRDAPRRAARAGIARARSQLVALAITATTTAAQASNCDAIRAQIDAKIKARGVTNHSLTVVGCRRQGKLARSSARVTRAARRSSMRRANATR